MNKVKMNEDEGNPANARQAVMLLAFIMAAFFSVGLAAGCSAFRESAKAKVVDALKTAFKTGGTTAVEKKLDSLVTEDKLTAGQAAKLKEVAQKLYDGILGKIEAECKSINE